MVMIPKQSQIKRRTEACLSVRLDKSLTSYVAAAGAAGVGLLAWAQPADAEVVYTPANQVLSGPYNVYQIDLNNDGIADINLTAYDVFTEGSGAFLDYAGINASAAVSGNEVVVNKRGAAIPGKRGQIVGSADAFAQFAYLNSHVAGGNSTHTFHDTNGPWLNMVHRFLGVKFLINGQVHYGWLRLNAEIGNGMVTGYAYETEPNTPIPCGFTQYDNAPTTPRSRKPWPSPEIHKVVPATLGALATGAAGLDAWRGNQTDAQNAAPVPGK
jgi:hypothetical protein